MCDFIKVQALTEERDGIGKGVDIGPWAVERGHSHRRGTGQASLMICRTSRNESSETEF